MNDGGGDAEVTRARVLELLAEGETGGVGVIETDACLARGDEYLDLEQLQAGVQRAPGSALPLRHVLTRKAVHEDTWRRILRQLQTTRAQ